ncbi:hypothetical protein NPX13_g10402 [Xylaria arbuscula]|uniref:Uncharacterized protein n=1 Tax=Xylaria arbuscula TaxID=114810 RepID=A0A9W8N4V8_9PEZI|nr:hypothetical protein NPX13_g10402 [Xylaria arbuscula]
MARLHTKIKIVEYPVGSRQWYILKCEKHTVHFKQVALRGAAKHLDSLSHGNLGRNRALAIKLLGYRVIDCNEELAAQNNKVVDEAFANGYEPENRIQAPKPKQSPSNTSPEVITDPKPFHVYQCFWSQNKCYYPVIILGWDDQTAGGLDTNLAGTGLLDKKVSNPPNCYVYKDIDNKTHAAIVGWSPQYEDGGSKIKQRKFPVKFFDRASNVGWVSARTLSKFPLFQASSAAKKEFHNAARRYIAKREGFSSWESFEATRKGIIQAPEIEVVTPEVSPLTATYEFNEDSGTDGCLQSSQSSNSNITQKELAEIRDTAGEIEGDDDYFESDVDSTLDEEFDWDQPGANGRPWASYHLRADDRAPHNTNTNTEVLPRECPETECTQEIASSVKDGSSLQSECQNIYTKGIIENDDTNKPSDNSPAPDTDTASIGNRSASSPKQAEWPAPCLLAKDARLVTESSLGPLVQSPSSYVSGHARLIAPEVIENKERLKRARCEENLGLEIGTPKPEDAKRIRLETEPPKSQVERSMPVVLQPQPTPQPSPPAVQPFVAYTTSGTDKFELSKYRKGLISWERGDDKLCLELWYQEDRKRVGTVDGTLNIVIDPVMLRGFVKGEIKGEKGNNFVTLLPRDTNDEPIELAFDRSEDGKNVIGNVQARRFWYWMRGVVPSLPLLTSSELNW